MTDLATTGVIVDNWSLQEIGDCLVNGLATNSVHEITIDVKADLHSFKDVPRAAVQIETLLDFLVDIVLNDDVYVDSAFTNTWEGSAEVFAPIVTTGLLKTFAYRDYEELLTEPRKIIVSDLCVTSSIRQTQTENEERWRIERKSRHPYMSALVWGTAGYLSRSHIFQMPYHGYSLRNSLIDQALFVPAQRYVIEDTKEWLDSERVRIFQSQTARGISKGLTLSLPPIAVEIINETTDICQLIPIAIQMRERYQKLRVWLKEIQSGLNDGNANSAAKFRKTLTAISRDLDVLLGKDDAFKFSLDITWPPAVSIEIPVLSGIRKNFGISAVLNRLLFAQNGSSTLRHLVHLFDERNTGLDLILAKRFQQRTVKS